MDAKQQRAFLLDRVGKTEAVCVHLEHIFQTIKKSDVEALTEHDLANLRIRLSGLDLEDDSLFTSPPGSEEEGTFFRPLPKSELPQIDWDQVDLSEWPEENNHETYHLKLGLFKVSLQLWAAALQNKKQPWAPRKFYDENPSVGISERTLLGGWQTCGWIEEKTLKKTHCGFQIYQYIDPDEALHRGEVLSIVRHMRYRMKQFVFIEHYTFPILVCSIFRSQARILQAYHDGEYLHISKSKFYDFKDNLKDKYELFTQWIHGVPCGRTKTSLPTTTPKLDNQTVTKAIRDLFRQGCSVLRGRER